MCPTVGMEITHKSQPLYVVVSRLGVRPLHHKGDRTINVTNTKPLHEKSYKLCYVTYANLPKL